MNTPFKTHIKKTDASESTFTFIPNTEIPKHLPVSTPMCMVYIGSELLLCLDKTDEWNVVCGKISEGEDWRTAIRREIFEEVGASVGELELTGYVYCTNSGETQFPSETIFPVCYAFVTQLEKDWKPLETRAREIFSHTNTKDIFGKRNDGGHMLEMYQYVHGVVKKNISYTFEYIPDTIVPNVITTSAMVFCRDTNGLFCVVKDAGEDFWSLPGGGCSLNEMPEKCASRELLEEAQIVAKNQTILGSILVRFFKNGKEVSVMQQVRCLCEFEDMQEFIPQKDGFETDERKFISFEELPIMVKQLMNDTGKVVLLDLKKKM
jgi:ADP-ribose pyrophosphatase YjhB (NUDIX family)